MEKKKIDRIIEAFRNYRDLKEEGMVVGTGGFTAAADSKGPVAGFDPVMGKVQKRFAKGGVGSRKKWLDYLKNK
jgi:hypothetical protein